MQAQTKKLQITSLEFTIDVVVGGKMKSFHFSRLEGQSSPCDVGEIMNRRFRHLGANVNMDQTKICIVALELTSSSASRVVKQKEEGG